MKNQIHVIYGKDPTLMTEKLLKATAPLKGLSKNIAIGIKPNLVSATPPSEGAVTHPEIVEGIIKYLKEQGFYNINIEGSWVGDETKRALMFGIQSIVFEIRCALIDLKRTAECTRRL